MMTIIEWCSNPGNLTNDESIVLPFYDCIIIIIFYIIHLAVSNQLYVLLSYWFQGTKNNFRLLFFYKTQQESNHLVIPDYVFLHTYRMNYSFCRYEYYIYYIYYVLYIIYYILYTIYNIYPIYILYIGANKF